MKNRWRSLCLMGIWFSLAVLIFATSSTVSASSKGAPKKTEIEITPVDSIGLGDPFLIQGQINVTAGNPVPEANITFSVDGNYIGQAKSSDTGFFMLKVTKTFSAGEHVLSAAYKGSKTFSQAETVITFKVLPAIVRVQSIPPIQDLSFRMNGKRFTTDRYGFATIAIEAAGQYRLDVLIDEYQNPDIRIEFGRWSEEDYESFRTIRVPSENVIPVGINVFHEVSQRFIDLSGYPVESGRISEYTVKSAQGDVFTFTDTLPHWIPASRIARRITGLDETKLLYSVINVIVDGSNVVNQAQQRFYTSPKAVWDTTVMLYSMQISARDGLFGSPVGKSINLEFPDGKIVSYNLDSAGNVEIHSLARGLYSFKLSGINGLKTKTPVALSRDQVVNVKVITYLDLAIVLLLGFFLAVGLLVYGRPWLMNPILKRKRQLRNHPKWRSLNEN